LNSEKIKAWFVSLRAFAIPWTGTNCLLGVALAGFGLSAWILAFGITTSILFAAHQLNSVRDFKKGLDKLEEGSEEKAYTSAQKILPKGILSVKTMLLSALAFVAFGVSLLLAFCPIRWDVWLIFFLGLTMTCSYHDFWKPRGLPEVALFLGHGFAVTAFAYCLVAPISLEAVSAGILLGIFAASASTVDAWKDIETDYAKKVKGLAWNIAQANLPISQFWMGSIVMIYTVQIGMVLLGLLPNMTLLTVFLLPLRAPREHPFGVELRQRGDDSSPPYVAVCCLHDSWGALPMKTWKIFLFFLCMGLGDGVGTALLHPRLAKIGKKESFLIP